MEKEYLKSIEKEFVKIGNYFKKQAYGEIVTRSTKCIEDILSQLLKDQIKEDEKLGLGMLLARARENNVISKKISSRMNNINAIRNTAVHPSGSIQHPKKKDAEEAYFTLAEFIREVDKGAAIQHVCIVCFSDWSFRGNNLCKKCYSERKEIDGITKKIREKINERLMEIRELTKVNNLKTHELADIDYLMKIDTLFRHHENFTTKVLSIDDFEELAGEKYTRYGKTVYTKPDKYYRQNKILDNLFGILKARAIGEKDFETIDFEGGFLLGDINHIMLGESNPLFKIWNNRFFEKPKEEYKEINDLLGKNDRVRVAYPSSGNYKSLDVMVWLEIFYLVSTYYNQLLAMIKIKRLGLERKGFLEDIGICSFNDFSDFLKQIYELDAKKDKSLSK